MEYLDALPTIKKFSQIIVTGPQRSGTTICAKMLTHDLTSDDNKYVGFDETYISTHSFALASMILKLYPKCVIQAPGLSAQAHLFPDDVLIVYMERPKYEIVKSQRRINWQYEDSEWLMYRYVFGEERTKLCISDYKNYHWHLDQKQAIKNSLEIRYGSLCCHELWVPADKRKDFNYKQTEVAKDE